jgi:transposase
MPRITSRVEHSPHKCTRIYIKYNCGISRRRIAAEERVSRGSICGIIKRYEEQKSAQSRPRAGQPTKLAERAKRAIFRSIQRDPFISLSSLAAEAGLNCHPATLREWLRKEGILHQRALRRPLLTPITARKRLQFANRYYRQPSRFWRRWNFSDETTVARGQGERVKWAFYRKVGLSTPRNYRDINHNRATG